MNVVVLGWLTYIPPCSPFSLWPRAVSHSVARPASFLFSTTTFVKLEGSSEWTRSGGGGSTLNTEGLTIGWIYSSCEEHVCWVEEEAEKWKLVGKDWKVESRWRIGPLSHCGTSECVCGVCVCVFNQWAWPGREHNQFWKETKGVRIYLHCYKIQFISNMPSNPPLFRC